MWKLLQRQRILGVLSGSFVIKSGSFYHLPDVFSVLAEGSFPPGRIFLRRSLIAQTLFDRLNSDLEICERMCVAMSGPESKSLRSFVMIRLNFVEKVSLPPVLEISVKNTPQSKVAILAKGSRGRWLFQVCPDWVSESDMEILVQEAKGFRKIKRKILIALSGIDQNAKLVAQECKMQLWDLRLLNTFMDYYDLPKIIITKKKTHDTQQKTDGSFVGTVAQALPALELR